MITYDDDAGDNKVILPSSSVHLVISNDDLLIQILLRLPIISLVVFKSVSKRWLSLIADPSFTLRRRQIPKVDPPSGVFMQRKKGYFSYSLVPRTPANKIIFKIVDKKILQSCNGLLLCRIRRPDGYGYHKYYVYNPTTNKFKMLPQFHIYIHSVKMAFDPIKSPHYKVIFAVLRYHGDSRVQVQIYSSETCNWTVYGDQFRSHCFKDFKYGVYWNDAIHWINNIDGTHDEHEYYYKLDVNHACLTISGVPKFLEGRVFESRNCLLLVCMVKNMYSRHQLAVYKMNGCSDQWSLIYHVSLDEVIMLIPQALEISVKRLNFKSIVMGEREEDLFLVMELSGKVFQYEVLLKTLCHLFDITLIDPGKKPCKKIGGFFPFIASFAGV